jgi:predicted O-methyltransferase YrrM
MRGRTAASRKETILTNENQWRAVDAYLIETIVKQDGALDAALAESEEAGLPPIEVSPPHAKMLHLVARLMGARRALEIGTLGGYSTIWIARALPEDGRVVTIEADERHAEVARRNLIRAGLSGKVEVRLGAALDVLPGIEAEGLGPFDFVFIDADKENNANYLAWALRLARPGTAIVVDNVVRSGRILNAAAPDSQAAGVRTMFEMMAREPRLQATAVQTVGAKGWDGFALAVVE